MSNRLRSFRASYYPKLWQAMISLKSFTVTQAIRETGLNCDDPLVKAVSKYFVQLHQQGVLTCQQLSNSNQFKHLYTLVQEDIQELPYTHRCWHYIWNRKEFTSEDLVQYVGVPTHVAIHFIRDLRRVGYLKIIQEKQGRGYRVYRLTAKTGPLPVVCRVGGVIFDPNVNETFEPISTASEEEVTNA